MSLSERIAYINRYIKDTGKITVQDVCKKFEVNERTVKRDIEYMRGRIGAPVVYSRKEKSYMYSTPFDGLDFADERVLLFYAMIEKLAENHRLLPIASKRILKRVREHITPEYLPLLSSLSYEIEETEEFEPELFRGIIHSILKKKRITFSYHDAKGRPSLRKVEALHILCYSGHWYCIAFDAEHSEIRKFLFARMNGLEMTEERFKSGITDSEVRRYLDSSFGIFKSSKCREAVFRLYEPVYYIGRFQKWHPKQSVKEGIDKERGSYVEVTIPVGAYEELLGKVLRYGEAAEAVAPADFRKMWLESIRKMAGRYIKPSLRGG